MLSLDGIPHGFPVPLHLGLSGQDTKLFSHYSPIQQHELLTSSVKRVAEAGRENPWIHWLWCVPPNPWVSGKSRGDRELQGRDTHTAVRGPGGLCNPLCCEYSKGSCGAEPKKSFRLKPTSPATWPLSGAHSTDRYISEELRWVKGKGTGKIVFNQMRVLSPHRVRTGKVSKVCFWGQGGSCPVQGNSLRLERFSLGYLPLISGFTKLSGKEKV